MLLAKIDCHNTYLGVWQFDGVLSQQELLATRQDGGKVLCVVSRKAEDDGEIGSSMSQSVCLRHMVQHVPQETESHVLVYQPS